MAVLGITSSKTFMHKAQKGLVFINTFIKPFRQVVWIISRIWILPPRTQGLWFYFDYILIQYFSKENIRIHSEIIQPIAFIFYLQIPLRKQSSKCTFYPNTMLYINNSCIADFDLTVTNYMSCRLPTELSSNIFFLVKKTDIYIHIWKRQFLHVSNEYNTININVIKRINKEILLFIRWVTQKIDENVSNPRFIIRSLTSFSD